MNLPKEVIKLLTYIEEQRYEAYVVGGSVRDLIMGDEPNDYDLITTMPFHKLSVIGKTYDIGKQKMFDIINLIYEGYSFEVTYFDGGLYSELQRRDFRMNSIALDKDGRVFDPFGGIKDIQNACIHSVNLKEKFQADPLRMMRAVRFSAKLGFEIFDKSAIVENSELIQLVSPERVHDELIKMASMSGIEFASCVTLMWYFGLLRELLPEVCNMMNYKERLDFHPEAFKYGTGTVFHHTHQAIKTYKGNDPLVNIALLLHDVGKTLSYGEKDGKPTYYNHEKKGLPLIESILKRLHFSNSEIKTIIYMVENHMRLSRGIRKPGKIIKLVSHKDWNRLKDLSYADDACRGLEIFDEERFNQEIQRIESIYDRWVEKNQSEPLIDGHLVMKTLNIQPGPLVGQIIQEVTDWIVENDIEKKEDIIEYLRSVYENS